MKKILAVILCVILIFSLCGCSLFEEKTYEHEDFRYIFEKTKDGEKVVRILGLTEDGKKKETIVIPHKLKNYDIKYIGRYRIENSPIMGRHEVIDSIGGNCKYLYIQADGIVENKVIRSSEEKTVFINKKWFMPSSFILPFERDMFAVDLGESNKKDSIRVHFTNAVDNMVLNKEAGEKEQFFYNAWVTRANLQFEWNVEGIQDKYWIDNVKTGSKIVAPPAPTRKSFTFGGWYKEKECINKWNFETDVTQTMVIEDGQKLTLEMKEREDYATYLYAKWV